MADLFYARAPARAGVARCGRLCHNWARAKEELMAKGQMRSSKEAKKPKSDKTKNSVSEYKKSLAAGGHNVPPAGKKS